MGQSRKSAIFGIGCVIAVAALMLSGCVERKLTINTEPGGALVLLNDEEIGLSPVTVSFNWYGDYKLQLSKQGYQTLNTHRLLEAGWHDHFPFDFFYGVIWPGRIVDEYKWSFELSPYQSPKREELIKSALKTRDKVVAAPEPRAKQ